MGPSPPQVLVDAPITASDKAGIDCPLGWPRRFVEFVAHHQAGGFVAPTEVAGKDWRRQLALRETDLVIRSTTGLILLSVAADRIGLAARGLGYAAGPRTSRGRCRPVW